MELGTTFLTSKIARRFCLLFILCAFLPSLLLIIISYNRVVGHLEEQSFHRLKRETKSYGLGLFDRLVRLDNELQAIARTIQTKGNDFPTDLAQTSEHLEPLFQSIMVHTPQQGLISIHNNTRDKRLLNLLNEDTLTSPKPFLLTLPNSQEITSFFIGLNIQAADNTPFSLIGEIVPDYLWGIGTNPLLPPMTELMVFDGDGNSLIATSPSSPDRKQELNNVKVPHHIKVFQHTYEGKTYYSRASDIFLESRFQRVDWYIVLSQAREDIMASLDEFRLLFPLITLLFLLLIIYLTVFFVRKGLEPLEKLKSGLKSVGEQDFSTTVDIQSDDEFQELGNSFNSMARQLDKQFHALTVLGEIDRAILSSSGRIDILTTTLQRIKEYFQCDRVIYMRLSSETEEYAKVYTLEKRRKSDPAISYHSLEEEEQKLLFHKEEFSLLGSKDSPPELLNKIGAGPFATFLNLPIMVQSQINRALLLGWKQEHTVLDDELKQARQIANQLSVALEKAILMENMEKLAQGTIEALARTVDAKSAWTSGHSERVAALGARIAKTMQLPEDTIETITRGGLLHDIGKIGIPLTILDKPDHLDEEEYARVMDHPAIGKKILEPIKVYQDILPVVAEHHERFDGTGYPKGLKGEEIDIRARILAVVDVYDALVSDRPYRGGWVHDRAKKLITEHSGTHFDPVVVGAFLATIED